MRAAIVPWALLVVLSAPQAAETVIRMDRPEPYELRTAGFELRREAEVHIDATGLHDRSGSGWWIERLWRDRDDDPLTTYVWILDADTRLPVWAMSYEKSTRVSVTLRRIEESIRLGPGRFELYFFSGNAWAAKAADPADAGESGWWERFSDDRRHRDDLLEDLEACGVELAIRGVPSGEVDRFEVSGDIPGALIRHNRLGDSRLESSGFRLDKPSTLRVYTLIEQTEGSREAADYAWIVRADSREVVWSAGRTRTRSGGGGKKNRLVDEEIRLDPGPYVLYYGTDDSHSFEQFNAGAPYDPFNWGVTLLPGDGFDPAAFGTFEPEDVPARVRLAGVGDGQTLEQPFRVDRDTRLWIHALGEFDDHAKAFSDGAWIVNAATGDVAWEMTEDNSRGAGGAEKNLMFDGVIELSRGDYVLYYSTDGSHSYESWNSAPPFEPEAWGVTVRPAPGSDAAGVTLLDHDELVDAGNFLVRVVGVGDDERRRQRFTLESASKLRIYALGEGRSGEMYDYAYIIDERTGGTIWEMEYERTGHAGGADKNRVVDQEVRLEPGSYEAVFVTDDSHAYGDWNAGPPRDPMNWGMTIRLVR